MTVTLTPNESLARLLRRQLGDAAAARAEVWEDPQVHSFTRWVRDQWLQCWPEQQLLHPLAERLLWSRLIAAAPETDHLIHPDALVPLAQQAANLALRYGIDVGAGPHWQHEHRVFARWWRAYRATLRDSGWITTAELPYALARHIAAGEVPVPESLQLRGWWNELSPDQHCVLDALRERGCRIDVATPAAPTADPNCRHYADRDTEWAALAQALARDLEADRAVIVALDNPDAHRAALDAALTEHLAPWRHQPAAADQPAPWRFESPPTLRDQPGVGAAIHVLELAPRANPGTALSAVLLSPSLWPAGWRQLTADAEYRLRQSGMLFAARDLERWLPEDTPDPLRQRLSALIEAVDAMPATAELTTWIEHWRQRLAAVALAERMPSSLYHALHETLTALGTLSPLAGSCGQAQALRLLRQLLAGTRHAEAPHDGPSVRIMDLETAACVPCDALYVIGMHDQILPARQAPTTLIDPELLHAAGVPTATPAGRLQHAQRLADALTGGATTVSVSSFRIDDSGAELLPSTLFAPLAAWTPAPATEARRASATPECTADPVPPVTDIAGAGLRGGTGIFKSYFEAPFFAFCKSRLGIEPRPMPLRGLPASEQGRLIHAVLEALWRDHLHDQPGLAAYPDEALRALVEREVTETLPRFMPAFRYPRSSVALEAQRAADVCCQWLAHERRRVDPFRVIAFEQRSDVTLAGLPLTVVIDRVDAVDTPAGRRYLILDYKTGNSINPGGWKVEKMEEPQLPLYASCDVLDPALIPHADGIAFGHVVDGRPALVAATNWRERLIEDDGPRISYDWDDTVLQWRERLLAAAADLLGGAAGLDSDGNYERSFNAPLLALAGNLDIAEAD